jgi:tetratricopeptide (TPR) repeat protein
MADKKITEVPVVADDDNVVDRAKDFWDKYSKPISYIGTAVIVLAAGYYGYKSFVLNPKRDKANEIIAVAQDYFAMDSLDKALNGDGRNPGFLKIEDRYSGTDAANLSHYYAGAIFLRKQDFAGALKQLKDFSSSATQVQSSAYRMMGDAYMETGKKSEGAEYYKKAGNLNDKDPYTSSENLFRAALAYETMGQNAEAIDLYKEVKEKYPKSEKGLIVDKYLARLGYTQQ